MYEYDRFQDVSWITVPREEYELRFHNRESIDVAYFRKVFSLSEIGQLVIDISANSRYRLWVNGQDVCSGPLKGDRWRQYYATVDISDYLQKGKNILALKVISYLPYEAQKGEERGPYWLIGNNAGPCLMVKGSCIDDNGELLAEVSTGKTKWQSRLDEAISWQFFSMTHWMGSMEEVNGDDIPKNWKTELHNIDNWSPAVNKYTIEKSPYGIIEPLPLISREIPLLFEKKCDFEREMEIKEDEYEQLILKDEKTAEVPPNSKRVIELDAGELTTGYFKLKVEGGKGTRCRIIYAESYTGLDEQGNIVKGKRDDNQNKEIRGHYDSYKHGGGKEIYQPFWFRTFRFVRIEIETGSQALTVFSPWYIETGYPLGRKSEFSSDSQPWMNKIWDMSWRTLQRCMHETYEDCPYYEQLQYVADTRLQILFNYMVDDDYRLAAKAIKDFHYSLLPEGIIQARYPSSQPHVIPQWAAHWIFMVEDYYLQTGDKSWLNKYRPTIDAVLNWYQEKLGEYELVENLGYWDQVDWVEEWTQGVSPASEIGPSAVQNLVYANVLLSAAKINRVSGRQGLAREYRIRAKNIFQNVKKHCWTQEKQLFREGPDCYEYSQHAQMWAVLTDFMESQEEKAVMKKAVSFPQIRECTYPFLFYFFRALEKADCYQLTKDLWSRWKGFLDQNLTTLPETPKQTPRSDCHAWSALPLYEFTRSFLGVKPLKPGWEKIKIEPYCGYLNQARGKVITPQGKVKVDWEKTKNRFKLQGEGPEDIPLEIILPEGSVRKKYQGGSFNLTVEL